jgi:hypothetical protein
VNKIQQVVHYRATYRGSAIRRLLHVFNIAADDRTTNVAGADNVKTLYVTVVKDPNDPQAKGSVVKIENVR